MIWEPPQVHSADEPLVLQAYLLDVLTGSSSHPCAARSLVFPGWLLNWSITPAPSSANLTQPLAPAPPMPIVPPLGFGLEAPIAIVPAHTLPPGRYTLTLSAAREPWAGRWSHQETAALRISALPPAPPPVAAVSAAPAIPGASNVSVAANLTAWATAEGPVSLRWIYAVRRGDGAAEWPLPGGATGGGIVGGQATWQGPVPWPPPPANASGNASSETEVWVGLRLWDGGGAAAGPFWAEAALRVLPGPCHAACGAPIWHDPVRHLACLRCQGPPPAAAHYLADHLLPALRGPACAAPQLLPALLHTATDHVTASPLDVTSPVELGVLQDVTVAVGACPDATAEADQALLQLLDAALLPGPVAEGPGAPRLLPINASMAVQLLALLDAHVVARRNCTFQSLAYATARLAVAVQRVPKAQIPATLTLATAGGAAGGVSVSLPHAVTEVVGRAVGGDTVDVVQYAVVGVEGLPAPVYTLAFRDPVTGTEVPVAGLTDPIALVFRALSATLYEPLPAWYQCAYDADGRWDTDGVWLPQGNASDAIPCLTSHLSTFTVLPLVTLTEARGCALDVAPSALHCPADSPSTSLLLTGGHFGPGGAAVRLSAAGAAPREWACARVSHVPGAEDRALHCNGVRLVRGPPVVTPVWARVTITTRAGLHGTAAPTVLFSPPPELTRIIPLQMRAGLDCESGGRGAVIECPQEGASFGVHGTGFGGYGVLELSVGPYRCPRVVVHNASYLECHGLQGQGTANAVVATLGPGLSSAPPSPLMVSFVPCKGKPGYWTGGSCEQCQPLWYGPQCALRCPALDGLACGGHGACDAGPQGTGGCACTANPVDGYWALPDCQECQDGYYGATCALRCPVARGAVCGGAGVCDGGRNGTGSCACDAGYAGAQCEVLCPVARGVVCGGHGACEAPLDGGTGVGMCNCSYPFTGEACSTCVPPFVGPACAVQCTPTAAGPPCAGHGECVWDAVAGSAACACDAGYVGPACTACPVSVLGISCGGHGTCGIYPTGGGAVCACDPEWAGAACELCADGWGGYDCLVACARHPNTSAVCSGRGLCRRDGTCECEWGTCGPACEVHDAAACGAAPCAPGTYGSDCGGICDCGGHGNCSDGHSGTGECFCFEGYGGPQCNASCAADRTGRLCSGHGRCDALQGLCTCAEGWGTPSGTAPCSAACPAPSGRLCSGHGLCSATARCECTAGYGGAACGAACPRDAEGQLCSGRGACDPVDGTCMCRLRFAGTACGVCAAGLHGAACALPCEHGTSYLGACVCDPGWLGANCSLACPGGALTPCSGHGACSEGATGTGSCMCDQGYARAACSAECPGGAGNPCSGHGTCDATTGDCVCQDTAAGHWMGPACDQCRSGFFGPQCTVGCPQDAGGRDCGGRGVCTGNGQCLCYREAARGSWAGAVCEGCLAGYYGTECNQECPGGACNACSGHGACRDGLAGDGLCVCLSSAADGFFVGAACGQCQSGYYSATCRLACPGDAATPCSGHGQCDDGLYGLGLCACYDAPDTGHWAGLACASCAPGYWGAECRSVCPGGATAPCGGQGQCGINGTCACAVGYVGSACQYACPASVFGVCSGHGLCSVEAGTAVCLCAANDALGHWGGALCDACSPGHYGPGCRGVCPGGPAEVCGGHGQCSDGRTGAGTCACATGFRGADCAVECPGVADGAVCGGHGLCNASGACDCVHSTAGHWGDPNCTDCALGWSGGRCNLPCPRDLLSGEVCTGHGACVQGTCLCHWDHCGVACASSGAVCNTCAPGHWGPNCTEVCPGGSAEPCSGHGQCLGGPYGTGECICEAGYAGVDCGMACPRGPSGLPCAAQGICSPATAACACDAGFAGPACATVCPRPSPSSLPCGGPGRGVCNEGAGGDGTCRCAAGYVGSACQHICPGAPVPCFGHGTCSVLGLCTCNPPFTGVNCTDCVSGFHGLHCNAPCVRGYSVAGLCVCYDGWAGPDCDVECAGGSVLPCSGHGRCRDGASGDGSCTCESGWAEAACGRACAGGAATPCGGHGLCRATNGSCECYSSRDRGYWTGSACAQCLPPWIGPSCLDLCPTDRRGLVCGGHGQCTNMPQCQCHSAPTLGFFTGPLCQSCQPGYYGAGCASACPGGACRPCSGHGTCDAGRTGTGACACELSALTGYWGGAACEDCSPGYYAAGCMLRCPSLRGLVCGGHGTCDDGLAGNGRCLCNAGAATGSWDGPDCLECAHGFYGPNCTGVCAVGSAGVCEGHGLCDDGVAGTGECSCAAGYVGLECSLACPQAADASPCGHGTCAFQSPATAICHCHQDSAQGHWVGPTCELCAPGYAGPGCTLACPLDCSGHGMCHDGLAGDGLCACDRGWGGTRCSVECPGGAALPCNGRGECLADGTCTCDLSRGTGFWAGSDCLQCAAGYSGPGCRMQCPVGGPEAVACSGHGVCAAGACVCDDGYCGDACTTVGSAACAAFVCAGDAGRGRWGPDCVNLCPGVAAGAVCGGHGVCSAGPNGTGACYCAAGWSGPSCSDGCPGIPYCSARGFCSAAIAGCQCLPGFAGPDCGLQCPGAWPLLCSSHGECRDGATGDGICTCVPGYAGAACDIECAGGAAAPCAGRGACNRTDGTCACFAHWAGEACQACGPGWFGPNCDQVCWVGTTVGQACVCEAGWALLDCSRECAGGFRNPCTGHGVCADTNAGDGSCTCSAGWRGELCAVACPGLLDSGHACSAHGTCAADGTCQCDASRVTGHWDGPACTRCALGWVGDACDRRCPFGANGTGPCSGHGVCDPPTEGCICIAAPGAGFWADASNCTECLPGYYGNDCDSQCPGGACDVCSGHGVCDEGRTGTGECACDPHWTGPACSQCAAGRYGLQCNSSCPMGLGASHGQLQTCSGRGTCLDGILGTGACVCTGLWAGLVCEDCLRGYYGPNCVLPCPLDAAGAICSGHGTCDDGPAGSGQCVCAVGYATASCAVACPAASGAVCNGVGVCDDGAQGTGRCNCTAAPRGLWAGEACAACATGWVGLFCDLPCPLGSLTDTPCSGRGTCLTAGAAAVCECVYGYGGAACERACPGGTLTPCTGHGDCDRSTAACVCAASPATGHWGGDTGACEECAPGWSGVNCTLPCPLGLGNAPCSGLPHRCWEGACVCDADAGACGTACNITGSACAEYLCTPGYWGPSCTEVCPGGPQNVCQGHGTCQSLVYATGRCECEPGYAGAECELVCPGGTANPCSGHGACDPFYGTCKCAPTYGGRACDVPCPRDAAGAVCAAHGQCQDGATGSGTCFCEYGYATASCAVMCPGFALGGSVCSGHGVCDPVQGTCACDSSWDGDDCGVCAPGRFGPQCEDECFNGRTEGTICVCDPGYGLPNCSTACPQAPDGTYCSGHGLCLDGHTRTGQCACDADYYTANCSVFCRPELCFEATVYPLPHPHCSKATGACECQDDRKGRWAGPQCNRCSVGFWGQECDLECKCSGHGGCGWLDGMCECFSDATAGYWGGADCGDCADGWLTPLCTAPNIRIARATDLLAISNGVPYKKAAVVVDERHGLVYTGGQPLLVFRTDTGYPVASLPLDGTCRGGFTAGKFVLLIMEAALTGARAVVRVVRGEPPVLWQPDGGGQVARRRARGFTPLAAAPGATVRFSEMLGHRDLLYSVVLTELSFQLQVQDQALHVLHEVVWAAAALRLDTVRAVALWDHPADGRVLVLTGAWHGSWQVVAVRVPPHAEAYALAGRLPLEACRATSCPMAGSVVTQGTELLVALEQGTGLLLAKCHVPALANATATRVRQTAALDWFAAGAESPGMSLDPLTQAVFLAINLRGFPSVFYRIAFATLVPYGEINLLSRGGTQESVQHLDVDPATRHLFALVLIDGNLILVNLLMYSVSSVQPPIADIQGNTSLLLHGEGFQPLGPMHCVFAGGVQTPATYVSPTQMACYAPPATRASDECGKGEAVELSLSEGAVTQNYVALQRVATPSVLEVDPSRGYWRTGQWVRLQGYGFMASALLRCNFYGSGRDIIVTGEPDVQLLSSTEMLCWRYARACAHAWVRAHAYARALPRASVLSLPVYVPAPMGA